MGKRVPSKNVDVLTEAEVDEAAILIINSHLKENGLVHQQIASYNYFIQTGIPTIVINSEKTFSCRKDSKTKTGFHEMHTLEFLKTKIQDRMVWTDVNGIQHKVTPHECRLRDLTYAVELWADVRKVVTFYDENGKENVRNGKTCFIKLGQIPVMVKSDVCMLKGLKDDQLYALNEDPSDPGGYFIVGGKEKVLIAQDRAAVNQPFVFQPMCDSKYQYEAEIRSSWSPSTDKICATWIRVPLAQSVKDIGSEKQETEKGKSRLSEILKNNLTRARPGVVATIPKCRKDIPLLILYRALNFITDKDIWKTFCLDDNQEYYYDMKEAMRPTFTDPSARKVKTQADALLYIGQYSAKQEMNDKEKRNLAREILSREVYPHVGKTPADDWLKGYHIGDAICKLMNVMVKGDGCDDRDHLKNKRFDMAGPLLANLFKTLFKNVQFTSKLLIDRKIEHSTPYEANDVIKWDIIEKGMNYALASGNWGDKRKSQVRSGVSQLLNRLNPVATLSHLRRVHSPVNRLVRMTPPRHLHNTFFGILCPAETPEGEQVGLVKNLSAMAFISIETANDEQIAIQLENMGTLVVEKDASGEINTEYLVTDTKVYLNGLLIGCHRAPVGFVKDFKKSRRMQHPHLPYEVSIFYDREQKEILIRTDAGRAMRPLFVVENNKLVLTRDHIKKLKDQNYGWENLLRDGVVEMLDTAETENSLIAMFPWQVGKGATYTHCEIHPAMILGICAGLIPYSNHNQTPRNTFFAAMSKQSIGFPMSNYKRRFDPSTHVLYYPQKPLVTTKGSGLCKYDESPCGINAIVAIAAYNGYNQEDSLIFNKSSLDRGLFRSLYYKTYHEDEINKEAGREERFEKYVRRRGNEESEELRSMDDDGLRLTGSELRDEEIVIGKVKMLKKGDIGYVEDSEDTNKRDASVMHRSCSAWSNTKEIIDSTIITENSEGYRMVKVRIRSTRVPQIGDKFASRHGQKGVIGMIYAQEDMMFSKQGITPDIIINPHAIPSRMTIGHMIESLVGKNVALSGEVKDGTPFEKRMSYSEIEKVLQENGFHSLGNEVMYVGDTGRKMYTPVFIGPTYYQRLKHMTEDKLHIRGRGPMAALCRQPLGGINRDGGLRFGEMERDCTIAHGTFRFLQERLMKVSDNYFMTVCNGCGYISDMVPSCRTGRKSEYLKCRRCRAEYKGSSKINLPYAAKTFFQELMAMNIRVGLMATDQVLLPLRIQEMDSTLDEPKDEHFLSNLIKEIEPFHIPFENTGEDDFRKEDVSQMYAQFPESL